MTRTSSGARGVPALLAALLLAGCTGAIAEDPGDDDDDDASGDDDDQYKPPVVNDDIEIPSCEVSSGPAPVRRLTRIEYDNTVRDLLKQSVRYAFTQPRVTVACHCSQCRKMTGTAFATWALAPKDGFQWSSGTDQIGEFQSSDHGRRLFCKRRGSTLAALTERRPDFVHVGAGTLDGTPDIRIAFHVHVASKASWYEINDALPRHEGDATKRG